MKAPTIAPDDHAAAVAGLQQQVQVRCGSVVIQEFAVVEQSAPVNKNTPWGLWLGVLVFSVTFVIDLMNGPWLKLATSALFLVACLLAATFRSPRPQAVTLGIIGCGVGAAVLVLYRLAGPGL